MTCKTRHNCTKTNNKRHKICCHRYKSNYSYNKANNYCSNNKTCCKHSKACSKHTKACGHCTNSNPNTKTSCTKPGIFCNSTITTKN